jgi:hypothetical protein
MQCEVLSFAEVPFRAYYSRVLAPSASRLLWQSSCSAIASLCLVARHPRVVHSYTCQKPSIPSRELLSRGSLGFISRSEDFRRGTLRQMAHGAPHPTSSSGCRVLCLRRLSGDKDRREGLPFGNSGDFWRKPRRDGTLQLICSHRASNCREAALVSLVGQQFRRSMAARRHRQSLSPQSVALFV